MTRYPCLRDDQGGCHFLEGRIVTIGSGASCQVRIQGEGVLEQHAFLLFKEGRWNLRALESGAKIRIDGVGLEQEIALVHGAVVEVGKRNLTFLERSSDASNAYQEVPLVQLLEAVVAFVRSSDPVAACVEMVQAAARQLGADGVRVLQRAQGQDSWKTLAACPASAPRGRFSERALHLADEFGGTVRMGETELDGLPAGGSIDANGIRSLLCARLSLPDGEEGFLYADRLAGRSAFGPQDEAVFGALANLFGEVAALIARTDRQRRSIEEMERTDASAGGILCESDAMQRVLREARRVASADIPVHVWGETGTGKELLARYIHENSLRASGPFVAINCGAIPEGLVESELFGHAKGAFTGAVQSRVGWIEKASGGTLFLDEMGEFPASLQIKLLRVLQEGEVVPVGGSQPVKVDFRLVTATHRDLRAEVEAGRFRADLFWRIHVVRLELPPLRSRGRDVQILAEHFLGVFQRRHGVGKKAFSRSAEKAILEHGWPGNVRELENAVQKAVLLANGEHIQAWDLGLGEAEGEREPVCDLPDDRTLQGARDMAEREAIVEAMRVAKGNISHAARILGTDRKVVMRAMERLGMDADFFRSRKMGRFIPDPIEGGL